MPAPAGGAFQFAQRPKDNAEDRDLAAANNQHNGAAEKDGRGESEKEPSVILYDNTELCQMTAQRACHEAQRKQGSDGYSAWCEYQKDGDDLNATRQDSPPRFNPKRGENEFRFFGATEFEEQCLRQDCRSEELENPAGDGLCFARVHGREKQSFLFPGKFLPVSVRF